MPVPRMMLGCPVGMMFHMLLMIPMLHPCQSSVAYIGPGKRVEQQTQQQGQQNLFHTPTTFL
jgi:hypothetical protein